MEIQNPIRFGETEYKQDGLSIVFKLQRSFPAPQIRITPYDAYVPVQITEISLLNAILAGEFKK